MGGFCARSRNSCCADRKVPVPYSRPVNKQSGLNIKNRCRKGKPGKYAAVALQGSAGIWYDGISKRNRRVTQLNWSEPYRKTAPWHIRGVRNEEQIPAGRLPRNGKDPQNFPWKDGLFQWNGKGICSIPKTRCPDGDVSAGAVGTRNQKHMDREWMKGDRMP